MSRTLSFKVDSGIDSVLRVIATLRRKQFEVKEFSMKESEKNKGLDVNVTFEMGDVVFNKAMLNVKKLEDVYDVKEVC